MINVQFEIDLGRARFRWLFFALVFGVFMLLVVGYHGNPAVTWMNMLELEAFRSLDDVWTYLAELRTGIPPALSALELFCWVNFRDLTVFSNIIYPVSIALAFTLAVLIQPYRPVPVVGVLLLGLLLIRPGIEVHAGNPAIYDPIFAALLLGYFALISKWLRSRHIAWLAAAGLTLAMLELIRPFMVLLLPVFLLVDVHRILCTTPQLRSALAAFLLPVVLLSGSWHLHLYLVHDGQITWTNVSGYNLQRAWGDFDSEIRDAKHVIQPPRFNGLWDDLNRTDVYQSSEAIKNLIIAKILGDPVRAVGYALDRIAVFGSAPTKIYEYDPQGNDIALYRGAVVILNLLLIIYTVVGAIILLHRYHCPWFNHRWWFATCVLLIALLVAVSERGEEGRFLFSILPMLLAVAGFALDDVVRWVVELRSVQMHTSSETPL
jgi:hypothetical protein